MKKILFVGQCKQGSNSLHKLITNQVGFEQGKDIRAMVRRYNNPQDYFDNWSEQELKSAKYLVDKSIVNPDKYDYRIGDWQNYNHKMIFMVRNIYKMLKSQFLVVLAGEESFQYNIPKFKKHWDINNLNEESVKEIMDYNKQKYTHYYNLSRLPKDIFDPKKNILFCTFEDFIDDTNNQFNRLEEFLDIKLDSHEYPRENSTRFEWYSENTSSYEKNVKAFEQWKDFIFDYCVDINEWQKLSEYTGFDFVTKYAIASKSQSRIKAINLYKDYCIINNITNIIDMGVGNGELCKRLYWLNFTIYETDKNHIKIDKKIIYKDYYKLKPVNNSIYNFQIFKNEDVVKMYILINKIKKECENYIIFCQNINREELKIITPNDEKIIIYKDLE